LLIYKSLVQECDAREADGISAAGKKELIIIIKLSHFIK